MKARLTSILASLSASTTLFAAPVTLERTVANSIDDFEQSFPQPTSTGWSYGYYNYTNDFDSSYLPSEFLPFVAGQTRGTGYGIVGGGAPWTTVDSNDSGHPNGTNSSPGEEQWVLRRYEIGADEAGAIEVDWRLAAANTNGSGTTLEVFQNGTQIATGTTSTAAGVSGTAPIVTAPGDIIDFALTPVGTDASRSDGSDGSLFGGTLRQQLTFESKAVIADSINEFPPVGTLSPQGLNDWTYGYYDITTNGLPDPGGADFIPMPTDGTTTVSGTNYWNGTTFDFPTNPPWTFIGQTDGHPNGTNNTFEHWATRRYTVQANEQGDLVVDWELFKPTAGTGTTLHIIHNGTILDSATTNSTPGVEGFSVIYGAATGDVIDIALSPVGLGAATDDGSDASSFNAVIHCALAAIPDFGTTPADTVATTVTPAASSLLDNDIGAPAAVTDFDGISALGATVAVNADGTFTYDPTAVGALANLPFGSSLVDTFDYSLGIESTVGADFSVDADDDTDGNTRWEDQAGSPFDLRFVGAVPRVTGTSSLPGITAAYDFPGGSTGNTGGALLSTAGTATDRSFQNAPGDWTNDDVTIEIWFKPDNLTPTPTNGQVLFEDGGGTGIGLLVDNNELRLRKAPGGGNVAFNISGIAGEFIHAVATYDVSAGAMELFVNGASAGTATPGGGDWSGGDPAGVGTRGGANLGGIGGGQSSTESFDGQIAKFAVYHNQILTAGEVAANYNAVSATSQSATVTFTVDGANDPPTALSATHNLAEDDGATSFAFTSSDPDAGDTANHIYRALTSPAPPGIFTDNLDGTFTYDPNGEFEALAPGEVATLTFDFEVGNPNIAPPLPSATLNYDGTVTDGSPATLESNGPVAYDAVFGADVTQGVASSSVLGLDHAYSFTGGAAVTLQSLQSLAGNPSDASASWEFWLRPSDTGDANQTVFETGGGGDGMGIWYAKGADADGTGTIHFTIDNGTTRRTVQAAIDNSLFHHVVAVYAKDETGTTDRMELYIDGVSVDVDTSTDALNDWAGGDGGGIGTNSGSIAETSQSGQFEGDIAIFRFHEAALTAVQVADAAGPGISTAAITLNIVGENDAPTANDDVASVDEDGPAVTGNVLTGAGADTDPDTNAGPPEDAVSVLNFDDTSTAGTVAMAVPQEIAFIGTVTGLTQDSGNTLSQTVSLGRDFVDPVVIAQPLSSGGPDAAIAQILSVDAAADTFTVRLLEPPNLDQNHGAEAVSFLVVEKGAWQLPDGTLLEAGTLDTSTLTRRLLAAFDTVSYASPFAAPPVVMSQPQTLNETDGDIFFKTRQRSNSAASFDVALEEAEGSGTNPNINSFGTHASETIGWVAIEASSGGWGGLIYEAGTTATNINGNYVPHSFGVDFGSAPNLVASMNTYAGADPTQLRQRNLTGTGVEFRAEEDTNQDTETTHANESVNYLALGGTGILSGFDQSETIGEFTYDPNGQFEELDAGDMVTDTFTYTVVDSFGETDTAMVTVTITGENDAPTVTPPGIADITINTSSPSAVVALFPHFEDIDEDDVDTTLTYTASVSVTSSIGVGTGTLLTALPVSSANGLLTLTTPCDLRGSAEVTVRATDSGTPPLFVEDTFTVTVADNVPPVITVKDIVANAPAGGTVSVGYPDVSAYDKVDGTVPHTCDPPDPSDFPVGTHVVNCEADDLSANTGTNSFFVYVLEIIPTPSAPANTPTQVAVTNDAAPGAGGASGVPGGALVRQPTHIYLNQGGDSLVESTLLGTPGANNAAVFHFIGGAGGALAVKGISDVQRFEHLAMSDDGDAVFRADTNTEFNVPSYDSAAALTPSAFPKATTQTIYQQAKLGADDLPAVAGIFKRTGGVTAQTDTFVSTASGLVQEGDGVIAVPGATFGQIKGRVVGNNAGNIAFSASMRGVPQSASDAVFTGPEAGPLTVAFREGIAAPGAGGAVYATFAAEAINNSGDLAVRAVLRNNAGLGVSSSNNEMLITNRNGPTEVIAREGGAAPCIPGAVTFGRITDVFMNDDGSVTFFAYLNGPIGPGSDGSLWRSEADGTLHIVAREGDIANSTQDSYAQILEVTASEGGRSAFLARLVPGIGDTITTNATGLWVEDSGTPVPQLLLRQGDELTVAGEARLITGVDIDDTTNAQGGSGGLGRVLNDADQISVRIAMDGNINGAFLLDSTP